jgi:hypothetical protein
MKLLPLFSLLAVASAAPRPDEAAVQDVQEAENITAEKPSLDMTANGVKVLPRFENSS